jgi:hypothetical protein
MADADNYAIKIKDLALFVRNVLLSPVVRMGHVKAFEKTSCKYPIRRVEVKVDTVPRGNMNYVQDNMFLGQLPKRLVAWTVLLLSVMSNGTFCTTTIVRKKGGDALPGMRRTYFR